MRRDPTALQPASSIRRLVAAVLVSALVSALVAGCASRGAGTDADQKTAAAANAKSLGQVADLRMLGGSAVNGKVRVVDRGDGATLTVTAFNIPTGPFRVTINRDANCTSPNGFSAGPPWAPPGSRRAPADLVGVLFSPESGSTNATAHVAGLRATGPDGVAGHSVLIYAGRTVSEAVPDVPNQLIACGVFEPAQTLQF